MFLSKAELFHESSWALWFQHAAGLLPVSVLRDKAGKALILCQLHEPRDSAYGHVCCFQMSMSLRAMTMRVQPFSCACTSE